MTLCGRLLAETKGRRRRSELTADDNQNYQKNDDNDKEEK